MGNEGNPRGCGYAGQDFVQMHSYRDAYSLAQDDFIGEPRKVERLGAGSETRRWEDPQKRKSFKEGGGGRRRALRRTMNSSFDPRVLTSDGREHTHAGEHGSGEGEQRISTVHECVRHRGRSAF